jgi:hypothetical protein
MNENFSRMFYKLLQKCAVDFVVTTMMMMMMMIFFLSQRCRLGYSGEGSLQRCAVAEQL